MACYTDMTADLCLCMYIGRMENRSDTGQNYVDFQAAIRLVSEVDDLYC